MIFLKNSRIGSSFVGALRVARLEDGKVGELRRIGASATVSSSRTLAQGAL